MQDPSVHQPGTHPDIKISPAPPSPSDSLSPQVDPLESMPPSLSAIAITDSIGAPEVSDLSLHSIGAFKALTTRLSQKIPLPYLDVQWYPVYNPLDIIRFNPFAAVGDESRCTVPRWIEATVKKKEELEVVFIVDIQQEDGQAHLPDVAEYIHLITEAYQAKPGTVHN